FLQHGAPTAWDGSTLTVLFESSYYEGQVTKPPSLSMITEELKAVADAASVTFRARTGKLPIGARAAGDADEEAPAERPRDLLEEHPGLRRAIHDLGGRLLPGDS
ncbi:hypothetical protein K8I85_13055, partial [bacterium]|nr:hypothetical protein [bacterium]